MKVEPGDRVWVKYPIALVTGGTGVVTIEGVIANLNPDEDGRGADYMVWMRGGDNLFHAYPVHMEQIIVPVDQIRAVNACGQPCAEPVENYGQLPEKRPCGICGKPGHKPWDHAGWNPNTDPSS